jgi:catechol 2,3-dioxygenase-like lactoylglutathione lyase family enzyme
MNTMTSTDNAVEVQKDTAADLKLEVVFIPVSDAERSKSFYTNLGWRLDADFVISDELRIVQVTPPGSPASIVFGKGVTTAEPGSIERLQLVVSDVEAARNELIAKGVEVGEIFHTDENFSPVAGISAERASYGSYARFEDPDGNGFMLQEIKVRLPGRVTGASYKDAMDLQEALIRAATAHGEHEKLTGEYDAEWPVWYAKYMVAEQSGEELPR